MTKLVLDSSVLVKWVTSNNEELVKEARDILRFTQKQKVKIFVPELTKFEVGNALWKKDIVYSEAAFDLELFYHFPIEFVSWNKELAKRTLAIAIHEKITYYDASFIALAEDLKATLVTDNPKHQKKSLASKIKVVALKEYK